VQHALVYKVEKDRAGTTCETLKQNTILPPVTTRLLILVLFNNDKTRPAIISRLPTQCGTVDASVGPLAHQF
jgi:hypothetical protein